MRATNEPKARGQVEQSLVYVVLHIYTIAHGTKIDTLARSSPPSTPSTQASVTTLRRVDLFSAQFEYPTTEPTYSHPQASFSLLFIATGA